MLKFIKNISLFGILLMSIYIVVIGIKFAVSWSMPFAYDKSKDTLFIGASHLWWGVDASQTKRAVNCSARSERYLFTYVKLKKILEANPQIAMVFIECAPTDLWENADDKYFAENEMSYFVPLYFPWFGREEWDIYRNNLRSVFVLISQKVVDPKQLTVAGIKGLLGGQADRSLGLGDFHRGQVHQELLTGESGNAINHAYLRKIIGLCKKHNVRLIGLYLPVYKPEELYNQEYYYDVLKSEFSDLEVLDYSHWEVPDSARLDASHLNAIGARMFTKEICVRFNID